MARERGVEAADTADQRCTSRRVKSHPGMRRKLGSTDEQRMSTGRSEGVPAWNRSDQQGILRKGFCGNQRVRMAPANRRSAGASVIAAIHHPLRRRLIDRGRRS